MVVVAPPPKKKVWGRGEEEEKEAHSKRKIYSVNLTYIKGEIGNRESLDHEAVL